MASFHYRQSNLYQVFDVIQWAVIRLMINKKKKKYKQPLEAWHAASPSKAWIHQPWSGATVAM